MPCYHPMRVWRSAQVNEATGKRPMTWDRTKALPWAPVESLPCGHCIGCKLEYSRSWAIRIMHEASMHDDNSFLTLTYNDESKPTDDSLNHQHFQLFFKRLRKAFPDRKIRYYMCGEYGEVCRVCGLSRSRCGCSRFYRSVGRPHYHACVFNFVAPDGVLYCSDPERLYISDILERLWGHGFVTFGDVTFESAAYVARYVTKKITGPPAADWYEGRTPEYATMSRGGRGTGLGGIGAPWLARYKASVWPDDFVVVNGRKVRVPKSYERLLEKADPEEWEAIRAARDELDDSWDGENGPRRLRVRERVQYARLDLLGRNLETE